MSCKCFIPDQKCQALKAPYAPIYALAKIHNTEEFRKLLIEAEFSVVKYDLFRAKCESIVASTGKRLLVALADGTVAYDSIKSNNTYANLKEKNINENHNTRSEMMVAQLSKSGIGIIDKYSTSANSTEINVALRIVDSKVVYPGIDAGTMRFSEILLL